MIGEARANMAKALRLARKLNPAVARLIYKAIKRAEETAVEHREAAIMENGPSTYEGIKRSTMEWWKMNVEYDPYCPEETCIGCGKRPPETGPLTKQTVLMNLQVKTIWFCPDCVLKAKSKQVIA